MALSTITTSGRLVSKTRGLINTTLVLEYPGGGDGAQTTLQVTNADGDLLVVGEIYEVEIKTL